MLKRLNKYLLVKILDEKHAGDHSSHRGSEPAADQTLTPQLSIVSTDHQSSSHTCSDQTNAAYMMITIQSYSLLSHTSVASSVQPSEEEKLESFWDCFELRDDINNATQLLQQLSETSSEKVTWIADVCCILGVRCKPVHCAESAGVKESFTK